MTSTKPEMAAAGDLTIMVRPPHLSAYSAVPKMDMLSERGTQTLLFLDSCTVHSGMHNGACCLQDSFTT